MTERTVIFNGQEFTIFDGITEALFNVPLFTNVLLNWEFGPKKLWKYCDAIGIDRVEAEIKDIMRMGGIRAKGAYLNKRLSNLCLSAA